ncbi:MAG: membrane protein insertase YidC, partial [Telluria sp.]
MELNKRTILWIVFAVSLIVLWNDWMVSNGKQSMFSSQAPSKVAATAPAATPAGSDLPAAQQPGAVPGTPAQPGAPAPAKAEIVTITTDVFKADIDTAGGVIKRLELLKFKDQRDTSKNQVLFDVTANNTYVAQTGLLGTSPAGPLPNHDTVFTARPGARAIDSKDQVQLVLDAEQGGVRLTKTFTFKRGEYVIDLRQDVTNLTQAPIAPMVYLQLEHDGNKPEGSSYFNRTYITPTLYTPEEKYQKLTFEKIEKGDADYAK